MSEQEDKGGDIVGNIFGWIGTVISSFFYIAPVVPIINLIKGKISYKDAPGILLICSFMNCILWEVYGIKRADLQVYVANGIGAVITIVWIFIFLVYFAQKRTLISTAYILIWLIITAGIFGLFYFVVDGKNEDAKITGYVAMVFNVLMYAAPGEKIYRVIKTGNYKLIPIFSTIGAFVCSGCWMMYGIYKDDKNIIIPNALGLLAAIIQVIVYLIVKNKSGDVHGTDMKENLKDSDAQLKYDSERETGKDEKHDTGNEKENENAQEKPDAEKENPN